MEEAPAALCARLRRALSTARDAGKRRLRLRFPRRRRTDARARDSLTREYRATSSGAMAGDALIPGFTARRVRTEAADATCEELLAFFKGCSSRSRDVGRQT